MKQFLYLFLICSFMSCVDANSSHLVFFEENKKLVLKNGVLFYNSIPFNGTLKSFNSVNQTNNTVDYLNGKKSGKELKLFLNDSISEIRFYQQGIKTGVHKAWRINREQKFEYPYNDKGMYHGTLKEWYPNGQLVMEFNYLNGKEFGTQKMWQSNGNIRANYTVINGERFGLIGLKKCYSINTNENK